MCAHQRLPLQAAAGCWLLAAAAAAVHHYLWVGRLRLKRALCCRRLSTGVRDLPGAGPQRAEQSAELDARCRHRRLVHLERAALEPAINQSDFLRTVWRRQVSGWQTGDVVPVATRAGATGPAVELQEPGRL
jgi:hypothetical protein